MSSSSSSDSDDGGVQVRIALKLASECQDKSLQVGDNLAPIAVPADVGRKGLSAVVNHLLDRRLGGDTDGGDDDDDDTVDERPAAIPFDFIVGGNDLASSKRLLRTGIEREARRSGLSLEEAIPVTYFPAQEAPKLSGESEQLPDWISALSFVVLGSGANNSILCAGCYDGSIAVFRKQSDKDDGVTMLQKIVIETPLHNGAIKCMDAVTDHVSGDTVLIATGSMDHTLQVHQLDTTTSTNKMKLFANCKDGHRAAIGGVDLLHRSSHTLLASGDWDGALCVWDCSVTPVQGDEKEQPVKKTKTGLSSSSSGVGDQTTQPVLEPKISIRAHSSKVSGVSWGNYDKFNTSTPPTQLITGSWDHSLKVWDIERQDCLLTLNGSRVVTCLDTSWHASGIVATGHPDCTVRLWDTRTAEDSKESSLMMAVSDRTFRPSHKEWISAVQWSRQNPYQLASSSHDGIVKLWDIRSPLPLHTVRAFPKSQKGLSLAYGEDSSGLLFAGGTDCIVKQFQCSQQ